MNTKSIDTHAYLEKVEHLVDKVEDWSALPVDPVVSVWMITYNQESYIRQAIDSVLMQQTTFPYEIVIGEDKSTDRTREIVQEYQLRHPDIIRLRLARENLYSQKLKPGIGVLHACCGKYIAMCEGDDYWTDPLKLQKQVDFLEANPECAMCFHSTITVYENTNHAPEPFYPPRQHARYSQEDLLAGNFISTCSAVYRASAIPDFPEWYYSLALGDWPLHVLVTENGSIGYLHEFMAAYRVHKGGVWSHSSDLRVLQGILEMAECLRRHFGSKHYGILTNGISWLHLQLAASLADNGDIRGARSHFAKCISEAPFNPQIPWADLGTMLARLYCRPLYMLGKRIIGLKEVMS